MTAFTTRTVSPFRYDVVGSFLRPQELKEARQQFAAGQISRDDLTAVEDRLIVDLIHKEEAAGLKAVTDGEFRRSYWHLDFFWGPAGHQTRQPQARLLLPRRGDPQRLRPADRQTQR